MKVHRNKERLYFLLGLFTFLIHLSLAWVVTNFRGQRQQTKLLYGGPSEKNVDLSDEEEKQRMAAVRFLQMSYYASERQPDATHAQLNKTTGMVNNLSLWRVQWIEVPGRSNVLNVHEPIYTNMFEKILYGPKPWCFGHLYLEGGSKNLKATPLSTWQNSTEKERSAVLGSLMKISDYRRMADGKLLLLVHAMERFVVADVVQQLPYSIANVQILPDIEEIDPDVESVLGKSEEEIRVARAMAFEESIRFHDYEYDPEHVLPMPDHATLEASQVLGSAIAKVLPYCPFSKTLEPPADRLPASLTPQGDAFRDHCSAVAATVLEYTLLSKQVLNEPISHPLSLRRGQNLTSDELEYELWLAINDFLVMTKTPVSPILLGLLPPEDTFQTPWPSTFLLSSINKDLANLKGKVEHDFVPVSPLYPSYRRQRRLSYSAAYLLENTVLDDGIRQILLEAPTTKGRLRLVLERFDLLLSQRLGEFQ